MGSSTSYIIIMWVRNIGEFCLVAVRPDHQLLNSIPYQDFRNLKALRAHISYMHHEFMLNLAESGLGTNYMYSNGHTLTLTVTVSTCIQHTSIIM